MNKKLWSVLEWLLIIGGGLLFGAIVAALITGFPAEPEQNFKEAGNFKEPNPPEELYLNYNCATDDGNILVENVNVCNHVCKTRNELFKDYSPNEGFCFAEKDNVLIWNLTGKEMSESDLNILNANAIKKCEDENTTFYELEKTIFANYGEILYKNKVICLKKICTETFSPTGESYEK